jgi:hypothetical protein
MPRATSTPYQIAERALIGLYDAGVLSPAVLERVIAAFADADIDWHTEPDARAVDGRSLHEIVASVMLPGQPLRTASKDFFSIVGHLAGSTSRSARGRSAPEPRNGKRAKKADEETADEDDLVSQLAGSASTKTQPAGRSGGPARPSTDFNPLSHATPPRRAK